MTTAVRTRPAPATKTGPARRTTVLCLMLAPAVVAATVPTVLADGLLRGPAVMNGSVRGTALVVLVVALPGVLLALRAAGEGSVRAHAVLVGALAYLTYNAMLFAYATPFNELYLAYIVLLALSLWTLVSAFVDPLPRIDPGPRFPVRGVSAFLLTVAVLNAAAWLRVDVPALHQDPPGSLAGTGLTTNPIHVQDLAVWIPAITIVAVQLWRRRPSGMFLAGAALVFWEIEAVGVAVDQWFGHRAAPTSDVATLGGAGLFVAMAALTLLPLTLWLRAAPARP